MSNIIDKENREDVLSFDQGVAFYLRMGRKHSESGDHVRAIYYLRRAYQKAPDDPEAVLALAEILNRMQRFSDSTEILLLYAQHHTLPPDGLFGLASNFMAMEEFDIAEICLNEYLKSDSDGAYAEDAEEYLDIITDPDELTYQLGLDTGEDIALLSYLHYVKALHLSKRDEDAKQYLSDLKEKYPSSNAVDLELAVVEFCLHEYEKSEQRLFNLLKTDSRNIRARCLLALLYRSQNRSEQAEDMQKSIRLSVNASTEELSNAAVMYLEFGEYGRAYDTLQRLKRMLPYDSQTLHQMGVCLMALGRAREAEQIYLMLLRLDETDTVAAYYLQRSREPDADTFKRDWTLVYDVPFAESFHRLHHIKEVAESGIDSLRSTWHDDASFRETVRWALMNPLIGSKAALIDLLKNVGDDKSVHLLCAFMLRQDQLDSDKQLAVSALRALDADIPHVMFYNGAWQYGRFRPLVVPERIPLNYEMILTQIQNICEQHAVPRQTGELAYKTCLYYIGQLNGKYPRLSQEQERAMAAAFLLLSAQASHLELTMEDIRGYFSVTERRLMNALKRIFQLLEGE